MLVDSRKYNNTEPKTNILLDMAATSKDDSELVAVLRNYLQEFKDDVINVALNLSSNYSVCSNIWKALKVATNSTTNRVFFAIPLVIVAGCEHRAHILGHINGCELLDWLCDKNIIESTKNYEISDTLVTPNDLAKIKFSDIVRYSVHDDLSINDLYGFYNKDLEVVDQGVFLRFIVGYRNHSDSHLAGINTVEFKKHALQLCKYILNQIANNASVTTFIIPHDPEYLSHALDCGSLLQKEIALAVSLSTKLRNIRSTLGNDIRASLRMENNIIIINIMHKDSIIYAFEWVLNLYDDFDAIHNKIIKMLSDMQVVQCE